MTSAGQGTNAGPETTTGTPVTGSGATISDGSAATMGASGGSSAGPGSTDSGTTAGDPDSTAGINETTGPPPQCATPEGCGPNETCNEGSCVSVCEAQGWAASGNYDPCISEYGAIITDQSCDSEDATCVYTNLPIDWAFCSVQQCETVCDCPAPPATGTAEVACGQISNDSADCYLDCSGDATCPTGMECVTSISGESYCTHPAPETVPLYGNCSFINAECEAGTFCSSEGSNSVCMAMCEDIDDCDPAPPGWEGGTLICDFGGGRFKGLDCHFFCNGGTPCPLDEMVCEGFECHWPSNP